MREHLLIPTTVLDRGGNRHKLFLRLTSRIHYEEREGSHLSLRLLVDSFCPLTNPPPGMPPHYCALAVLRWTDEEALSVILKEIGPQEYGKKKCWMLVVDPEAVAEEIRRNMLLHDQPEATPPQRKTRVA
jgi:hypothetical protein